MKTPGKVLRPHSRVERITHRRQIAFGGAVAQMLLTGIPAHKFFWAFQMKAFMSEGDWGFADADPKTSAIFATDIFAAFKIVETHWRKVLFLSRKMIVESRHHNHEKVQKANLRLDAANRRKRAA